MGLSENAGQSGRFGWIAGRRVLLALFLILNSTACVENALREGREPMDYGPPALVERPPATDGSVWRGSSQGGTFLFFDEKASSLGDLVTVVIVEQTRAQGDARTETDSQRSIDGSISSDVGFQKFISSPIRGLLRMIGLDDPGTTIAEGTELNVIETSLGNEFTGQGTTSRSGQFTGIISCRVVGVLPNGVLHIRGRRSVIINHEAQYISLEGLVRREDLSVENQVLSNFVAEMRLAYDGIGVLDDKQRPGWMARVFDWVYPF
jgi:flagellar L-ring protein precursor FlgH